MTSPKLEGHTRPRAGPEDARIVLLARARPQDAHRLCTRIEGELQGASVCGVLYVAPTVPAQPVRERARAAVQALWDSVLRWVHASPDIEEPRMTVGDLVEQARSQGRQILVSDDPQSLASYDFVSRLDPDLGVVLDDGSLPEQLLALPRLGSLVARLIPARLTGSTEARIRAEILSIQGPCRSVVSSCTLNREPYDTPLGMGLKANLAKNDLLLRAVSDLLRVPAVGPDVDWTPRPCAEPALPFKATTRPLWRMLVAAFLLSPYWAARNWWRRRHGRFPVIIFFHHLVSDRPHRLGMPTDHFYRSVRFLQKHYRVVGLAEATQLLASGSVKSPTAVLTFDDGYRENFLTLRAVFEETGVPVTMFVNPGLIDEGRPLRHDLERGERSFPPLTWDQVDYLARNGFEIGSHTRSHYDCGSHDEKVLKREIRESRDDIQQRLNRRVVSFAFPWGHSENMSSEAIEIAQDSYPNVLAAAGGENWPGQPVTNILRRCFQCASLTELEFNLQSAGDRPLSLFRAFVRGQRPETWEAWSQ